MIENSLGSALFTALNDWLETNANEIDWGVYNPQKSVNDRPSGCFKIIPIPKVHGSSLNGNIRYDWKLHIRVDVRDVSENSTLIELHNIESYLHNLILNNLRKTGISGTYLGQELLRELVGIKPDRNPVIMIDSKQDSYTPGLIDLFFIVNNP